jgi:hypothetical protein
VLLPVLVAAAAIGMAVRWRRWTPIVLRRRAATPRRALGHLGLLRPTRLRPPRTGRRRRRHRTRHTPRRFNDPRNVVNRLTTGGANGVQIEQPFAARRDHGPAIVKAVVDVYRAL